MRLYVKDNGVIVRHSTELWLMAPIIKYSRFATKYVSITKLTYIIYLYNDTCVHMFVMGS